MSYKKDCKFLVKNNSTYVCNAEKIISFGCDSDCGSFALSNDINAIKHYPAEVIERIQKDQTKYEHDKNIRELLEFTNFTGYLLTLVIRELKGISLEQFKKSTGGDDFLTVGRTEYAGSSTKDIHLDLVIEYDDFNQLKLRVDVEPQDSQETYSDKTKESYSLIARAVYYASTLLATALQPGESYHNLRKVYSVWICFKRPIADLREPIIRYNITPEKDYKYCKKDSSGEDSIYSCRHKFDDGDILSVILISVPDIETALKNGQLDFADNYDEGMLKDLYSLLSPKVSNEERMKFYADKHIDDGGEYSVNVVQRLKEELARRDAELAKKDEELTRRDEELTRRDEENVSLKEEIAKLRLALQKQ